MKNFLFILCLISSSVVPIKTAGAADSATNNAPTAAAALPEPPKLKTPNTEERLADLEAYINNGARANVANTNLDTKVGGPGPGHNSFQMICTALVLFMT